MKQAFVKALRQSGVGADEVARVREPEPPARGQARPLGPDVAGFRAAGAGPPDEDSGSAERRPPRAVRRILAAGRREFVSRGIPRDPELFLSLQVADKISSVYDLTVSGDGTTATLKVVKSAQLLVGTEDSRMATHFGSVVVEEEMTVDIASETPTVRNVRVSQVFDVADDLHDRYLRETAPIPPPPPDPPAAVRVLP